MNIALINGSPKPKRSASGIILTALQERIGSKAVCAVHSSAGLDGPGLLGAISGCDAIVFAFPLYADGVPSHLLRLLDYIQCDAAVVAPGARVYAISNSGFYEGKQNAVALEIMRNFCERAGLAWGRGIGVGAGAMIGAAPVGRGPMKNLGRALDDLAGSILSGETAEDHFFQPNFPRFLYIASGHSGWRKAAKKRGLRVEQLYDKPQVGK